LVDLIFNAYLTKTFQAQESLEFCKTPSKKIPSLIIKLSKKKFKVSKINNIKDCWLCDLIFYDDELKQFSINYRVQ